MLEFSVVIYKHTDYQPSQELKLLYLKKMLTIIICKVRFKLVKYIIAGSQERSILER